jgi:hypothetical protein
MAFSDINGGNLLTQKMFSEQLCDLLLPRLLLGQIALVED